MIEEKDIYKLNYVLNQLGKRILPQYFYEKSPEKMVQWQNQICKQSHVIASYFLNKWLNEDFINYNIEFFEGIFKDNVTGDMYNHSWVYIESISNSKDCYICDIARISQHIGFRKTTSNNPGLFITDEEFLDKRRAYSWKELLKQKEYYTSLIGSEVVNEIENRLTQNRLNLINKL